MAFQTFTFPRGWPEFEPRQGTRLDLQAVLELDDDAFRFRGLKRTDDALFVKLSYLFRL